MVDSHVLPPDQAGQLQIHRVRTVTKGWDSYTVAPGYDSYGAGTAGQFGPKKGDIEWVHYNEYIEYI